MTENLINKLTHEEIHSARPLPAEVIAGAKFPVTVVLENIRSLYNVGSIFRTSDGAAIEKLYLCGYTGHPPRKEIDKTALGSVDCINWVHSPDTAGVISSLKKEGYEIICLEHTDRSEPYDRTVYDRPLCLVLGNEVDGVTQETISLCDRAIEIPMHGVKQSLNVAVAYGIAVYHIVRNSSVKR
jgi:tRNA G18 (ribose-2'-O)-methylase SpoU